MLWDDGSQPGSSRTDGQVDRQPSTLQCSSVWWVESFSHEHLSQNGMNLLTLFEIDPHCEICATLRKTPAFPVLQTWYNPTHHLSTDKTHKFIHVAFSEESIVDGYSNQTSLQIPLWTNTPLIPHSCGSSNRDVKWSLGEKQKGIEAKISLSQGVFGLGGKIQIFFENGKKKNLLGKSLKSLNSPDAPSVFSEVQQNIQNSLWPERFSRKFLDGKQPMRKLDQNMGLNLNVAYNGDEAPVNVLYTYNLHLIILTVEGEREMSAFTVKCIIYLLIEWLET